MSKSATMVTGTWHKYPKTSKHPATWTLLVSGGFIGQPFTVTSQAGVTTTGTLDAVHKMAADGRTAWTVTRDKKSPEQRAIDMALRAESVAAYYRSDKGIETAAKMAARADKAATVETVTAPPVSAPVTMDLGSLIASFIQAGMDPVTAAQTAMATMAATPTVATPSAPIVSSNVVNKRVKTAAQLANDARLRTKTTTQGAPGATIQQAMASSAMRLPCDACGKQDKLTPHAGHPGLKVCATCLPTDSDTVANRALRRTVKLAK